MNTKDQPAAIAPSVEEYAACKRKLARLQAEAIAIWDRMSRVGALLSAFQQQSVEDIGNAVAAINQETQNFPTVGDIRKLAAKIKTEIERKQELYTALKNIGVEPEK